MIHLDRIFPPTLDLCRASYQEWIFAWVNKPKKNPNNQFNHADFVQNLPSIFGLTPHEMKDSVKQS